MTTATEHLHPFPGLRPFQTEEEELFFGRDGQSEEILRRLRENRFLAVVGASGSGKSSLIRAGLLPHLHGGFMAKAGSHWRTAIFRPGNDPIGNLARALNESNALGTSDEDAERNAILLEVTLRRSGIGLIEAVRLAGLRAHENVLVIVDQFEELFRFAGAASGVRTEDDAAAFVKLLLEGSGQNDLSIYVVLTMRSDFIGDCARFQDLPEAVTSGLYLIPRMTREQRREAIENPVRAANAEISRRLVNRLLNDVGDNPDQLPILQHAMMRTWDYWQTHHPEQPVDLEDYAAIGAMSEALSRHADEAYGELSSRRQQMIAKRMFQCLTEKGPDNREVRRPSTVAEIAAVAGVGIADVITVVESFRRPDRSFLMPPPGVPLDANSIIDISHESLIRGWERLHGWVSEESESAKIYRRLAETAALNRQNKAGLWRDPDLINALTWRAKEEPNAAWAKRYNAGFEDAMDFLERSRADRDAYVAAKERRRLEELRRWRWYAGAITVALVIALSGIGTAYWQKNRAHQMAAQAESARNVADAKARENRDLADKYLGEKNRADAEAKGTLSEKNRADAKARENRDLANMYLSEKNRANTKAAEAEALAATAKEDSANALKLAQAYVKAKNYSAKDTLAARYYSEAIALAEPFTKRASNDPDFKEMAMWMYVDRGDVHRAMKNYTEADADYGRAKTWADLLDPTTDRARHDRLVMDQRMGSVLQARAEADSDKERAAKEIQEALRLHLSSLQINRDLEKTDKSAMRKQNLAIAEYNVGTDYLMLKDFENARIHLQAQIDDYLDANRLDPAHRFTRDVANSYGSYADLDYEIGRSFLLKKDYENGRIHYRSRIDSLQKEFDTNPTDDTTRYLETGYKDLALLEREARNFAEARTINNKRISLLKPLTELKAATASDKVRLATVYQHLALVEYDVGQDFLARNDLEEARKQYQLEIDYFQHEVDLNPAADPIRRLETAYDDLAIVETRAGNIEQARAANAKRVSLLKPLADAKTAAARDKTGLGRAYADLASTESKARNFVEARKLIDAQIGVLKPVVDAKTASADDKHLMAGAYLGRSWYDLFLGEFDAAVADVDTGLSYDPNYLLLLTNKAHGLLFLGRKDEATTIYVDNANKKPNPSDPKTFGQFVLEDFVEFRKYPKLTRPEMDEIEKTLKGLSAAGAPSPNK